MSAALMPGRELARDETSEPLTAAANGLDDTSSPAAGISRSDVSMEKVPALLRVTLPAQTSLESHSSFMVSSTPSSQASPAVVGGHGSTSGGFDAVHSESETVARLTAPVASLTVVDWHSTVLIRGA